MTELRWLTGSAMKRASAARAMVGSGDSSYPATSEVGAHLRVLGAVPLEIVDDGVVRDLEQPRPERWRLGIERERIGRPRERLLDDVIALDHRPREPGAAAVELGADPLDDGEELVTSLRDRDLECAP
jgi:hypothetical protein